MNTITNEAWAVAGITPAEKLVLVRLADRADKDGLCYPGQASIARECCVTTRAVSRAVRRLVTLGHLSVVKEPTWCDPRVYRVTPQPERGDNSSPPDTGSPPDNSSPERRQQFIPPPDNSSPGEVTTVHPNHQLTISEPTTTTTGDSEAELFPKHVGKARSEAPDPLDGFDQFWLKFPKKDGKLAARKAWKRLRPSPEVQLMILADVARRTAEFDWQNTPARYFPGPGPYLNGERWRDEGVTPAVATGTPVPAGRLDALRKERAAIVCKLPANRTSEEKKRLPEIEAALRGGAL